MPETSYYVRRAPREWFKGSHTHGEEILQEQESAYHIIGQPGHPDGEGYGAYTEFQDIPFPRKCIYDQDFLAYANIVKRITLGLVRVAGSRDIVLPGIGFALLPWNRKIKLMETFLYEWWRMAEFTMRPGLWSEEQGGMKRYCTMVRELHKFIELFLDNLGIKELVDGRKLTICVAEVGGAVVEYDDSYRFRLQDIFGEINKEWLLADPAKEINRVLEIYKKREKAKIEDKFDAMAKAITLALKISKIKKAFLAAAKEIDFKKLALDKADKYWAFKKSDYDFCGMNWEQRKFYINNIHGFFDPPAMLMK